MRIPRGFLFAPLLFSPAACAQAERPASEPPRVDVAKLGPEDRKPFLEHLEAHARPPVDYLVEKCGRHDVVLLGEIHMVAENCMLVAESLPALHQRAGVRLLAMEFLRSRNSERAGRLVAAAEFDEQLALELFRDGPWPTWGFREYIDILRAAWKLNRSLPAGAEPLRVVGLDSDWEQYDLWFGGKSERERFEIQMAREKNMVGVVEAQAFVAKRRTLVYVGFAHTVLCQGVRLGTVLHQKYGDRIFQVSLHRAETVGKERRPSALTRFLESLHAEHGGVPIGFDVIGSPLAHLVDSEAPWGQALKDPRFAAVNQGYLIIKPLAELHGVAWVKGFVTEALFEKARAVAERAGYVPKGACPDAAALDARLAERFAGGLLRPGQGSD